DSTESSCATAAQPVRTAKRRQSVPAAGRMWNGNETIPAVATTPTRNAAASGPKGRSPLRDRGDVTLAGATVMAPVESRSRAAVPVGRPRGRADYRELHLGDLPHADYAQRMNGHTRERPPEGGYRVTQSD